MDYLLCRVNSPSSSSSSSILELKQGLCFQEFGLKMWPALAFMLIPLTSMMARGKDVAGRNEYGVGRRKLTGRKECDCWGCQMSKCYFNSSSENHLILMSLCYLSKSGCSAGLPSTLEKTPSFLCRMANLS